MESRILPGSPVSLPAGPESNCPPVRPGIVRYDVCVAPRTSTPSQPEVYRKEPMRFCSLFILYLCIVCLSSASAWDQAPELFDLSGIPDPPASFAEQQILEMVAGHKRGD